jgi:hypothetical protein
MGFLSYLGADILGIVLGLCAYDWLVSVRWIKVAKKSWKYLSKQLVGLFKKRKPIQQKRKGRISKKGEANDIY